MTEFERQFYLLLLICGREEEATQYAIQCEKKHKKEEVKDDD